MVGSGVFAQRPTHSNTHACMHRLSRNVILFAGTPTRIPPPPPNKQPPRPVRTKHKNGIPSTCAHCKLATPVTFLKCAKRCAYMHVNAFPCMRPRLHSWASVDTWCVYSCACIPETEILVRRKEVYCSTECVSASWYSAHKSSCQAPSQDHTSIAGQHHGVSAVARASHQNSAFSDLTQTLKDPAAQPSDASTLGSVREPSALRLSYSSAPTPDHERPPSRSAPLNEGTCRQSPVWTKATMINSFSLADSAGSSKLQVGSRVKVRDLRVKSELNGQEGTVNEVLDKGRVGVLLDSDPTALVSLAPENLTGTNVDPLSASTEKHITPPLPGSVPRVLAVNVVKPSVPRVLPVKVHEKSQRLGPALLGVGA